LSSFVALLVFGDGIHQIRPQHTSDLTSFYLRSFGQMLLFAGLFSPVYLAVVSSFSARYRSSHKGELLLSSAACGVGSAFFFAMGLRVALALTDRWLIPAIIIAVVAITLPALFVLESLKRRSSENGITSTRSNAVLLSSAYAVTCIVALVVAHLPMWPRLHLYTGAWNPEISSYVPLLLHVYIMTVQVVFQCSVFAMGLWFMHVSVLASVFRRWQYLPQRWFVFGSVSSGLLAVVIMEAAHLVPVNGTTGGAEDSILMGLVLGLLRVVAIVLLPTFVIFDALVRRRRQRARVADR
jgi:hypothetical protein